MAARLISGIVAMLLAGAVNAASLPDPTALPRSLNRAGAETVAPESVLEWVRVNGRESIAWYGGRTVQIGDATEGGQVYAILEDHIVISGKNGRRSVYLLDRSNRTQSPRRPATAR